MISVPIRLLTIFLEVCKGARRAFNITSSLSDLGMFIFRRNLAMSLDLDDQPRIFQTQATPAATPSAAAASAQPSATQASEAALAAQVRFLV